MTILPLLQRTLAHFRMAELGFLGFVVKILAQTPLTKGAPSRAGVRLGFGRCGLRAPRTTWRYVVAAAGVEEKGREDGKRVLRDCTVTREVEGTQGIVLDVEVERAADFSDMPRKLEARSVILDVEAWRLRFNDDEQRLLGLLLFWSLPHSPLLLCCATQMFSRWYQEE